MTLSLQSLLPMFEQYIDEYQLMTNELEQSWIQQQTYKSKADACFWIAKKHIEALFWKVKTKGFCNEHFEINFFKVIKPCFTCEMEYYVMLSEALEFEPDFTAIQRTIDEKGGYAAYVQAKTIAIRKYWDAEIKRSEVFYNKHAEGINYFIRGETEFDHCYFTHKCEDKKDTRVLSYLDRSGTFTTYYARVARSYLARNKFKKFATELLSSLPD